LGMMLLLLQIDPPQKRNVLGQSNKVSEVGITKLQITWDLWGKLISSLQTSWAWPSHSLDLDGKPIELRIPELFSSSLIILCDSCSVTRSGCCNSRKPLLTQTN
jgi:hypothetical protein